jgi:XrtJ-associated TM-motif-TM protein
MKLFRISTVIAVVMFAMVLSAHAQGGCTDSPEAPTDILLIVGAVGVFQGSRLVQWLRKR